MVLTRAKSPLHRRTNQQRSRRQDPQLHRVGLRLKHPPKAPQRAPAPTDRRPVRWCSQQAAQHQLRRCIQPCIIVVNRRTVFGITIVRWARRVAEKTTAAHRNILCAKCKKASSVSQAGMVLAKWCLQVGSCGTQNKSEPQVESLTDLAIPANQLCGQRKVHLERLRDPRRRPRP